MEELAIACTFLPFAPFKLIIIAHYFVVINFSSILITVLHSYSHTSTFHIISHYS